MVKRAVMVSLVLAKAMDDTGKYVLQPISFHEKDERKIGKRSKSAETAHMDMLSETIF